MENEIKTGLEDIQKAHDAFVKTHNDEIAELKKGAADVVTTDKLERISDEMTKLNDTVEELQKKAGRPGAGGDNAADELAAERKSVLEAFVREGDEAGYKAANKKFAKAAKAAGTTTANGWGDGVLTDTSTVIEERLRNESSVRDLVTTETRGSTDIKDLLDVGGTSVGWRGEGAAVAESGVSKLVPVTYGGGMLYAMPKTTEESLDDLFFNVEAFIQNTVVDDMAEEESKVIISGDGIDKPKGMLNETMSLSDDGARTFGELQFVASGVAATIGTDGDVFIDLQAELHGRYSRNAQWGMHRKTLASIRKFKNGQGDYIYQQALTDGTPQQLLGDTIALLDDMPLQGAGTFPIAYGDWKKAYKLFPIVGMRMTRDEVTSKGNVLFYVRRRLFGGVYDPRSIKFLKCSV